MIIKLVKVLIAVMIVVVPLGSIASFVLTEYFAHGTCTFITTYPCTLDESLLLVFFLWYGSGLMFLSIVALVLYGVLLIVIRWIRRSHTTPSAYAPPTNAEQ